MLPCQSGCPNYHCGCHKTCESWQVFQQEQALQRQAKKRYLQFHQERCAQMTRQYLAMQAKRPAW
jgi:hypothetical protein